MSIQFDRPDSHPHVAVVTIDRPARANALDPEHLAALAQTWRSIASDPDIRCAVLTGAGDRVFCAGMDMAATIPASQRLAAGERVSELEFEGLRSVSTALLAGFHPIAWDGLPRFGLLMLVLGVLLALPVAA